VSARILIVEDEGPLARSIQRSLEREGHEVAVEESAEGGLDALGGFDADLVLLDLLLPGMSGMEFLRTLRDHGREPAVIVMSAHSAVRSAVEAMRLGAFDYVTKPLDLDELKIVIARALDHGRLSRELAYLRERDEREAPPGLLLGECPAMRELRGRIERIARMERQPGGGAPPVLIVGETGTGKGLVARSIHRASSRAAGPFIEVHCGALAEDELFGHDKGGLADARASRRGLLEAADGGTLCLDAIGQLGPSARTRLLQIIETQTLRRPGGTRDRRVDVRIIAAANRDPGAAGSAVLAELLHRLQVLSIELPPLRERGDDAVLLAEHFARQHAEQYGVPVRRLSSGAREILLRYAWPGNVWELVNEIERTVLLETGEELALEHLRRSLAPPAGRTGVRADAAGVAVDLPPEGIAFELIERGVLERALDLSGWNVTRAARLLRLSRDTLRYRMERLNLSSPPGRG
jgi:DNA-binding NtrC family response regulator